MLNNRSDEPNTTLDELDDEPDLLAFLPDDQRPGEDELAFTILRRIYNANPQFFNDQLTNGSRSADELCAQVSVSYKDLKTIAKIVELCDQYDEWSVGDLLVDGTLSQDDIRQFVHEINGPKSVRRTRLVNKYNN